MLAVCPDNPEHKQFGTVVHQTHDWMVDETGELLNDLGLLEVTHGPNPGNTWTCMECGAAAVVTGT